MVFRGLVGVVALGLLLAGCGSVPESGPAPSCGWDTRTAEGRAEAQTWNEWYESNYGLEWFTNNPGMTPPLFQPDSVFWLGSCGGGEGVSNPDVLVPPDADADADTYQYGD